MGQGCDITGEKLDGLANGKMWPSTRDASRACTPPNIRLEVYKPVYNTTILIKPVLDAIKICQVIGVVSSEHCIRDMICELNDPRRTRINKEWDLADIS